MLTARPQLRRAPYGQITQGSVFCCARASRYEDCDVNGLVITARCDIAQSKYPVLNYLPIVSLRDWLRRDGLDILLANELNKQRAHLNGMLRSENVSPSIVESVPLETIASVHFPLRTGSKKKNQAAQKFHDHVALMRNFCCLRSRSNLNDMYTWFCVDRKIEVRELIKRLSHHSVLGHYFFETLTLDAQHFSGFVCLLREVSTLPKPIAEALGRGLTASDCFELLEEAYSFNLSFSHEDIAMPIAEIGSPTIEHVLQQFSTLFGRIGVPDPVKDDISAVVSFNLSKKRSPK